MFIDHICMKTAFTFRNTMYLFNALFFKTKATDIDGIDVNKLHSVCSKRSYNLSQMNHC